MLIIYSKFSEAYISTICIHHVELGQMGININA